MNRPHQLGFTLWELLMTLLVVGVLLGIGVPNVMEFQRNGRMAAAANDLVTAMLRARTEAVKRQAPTAWCLSNNPLVAFPTCLTGATMNSGTPGYIVWVDENDNFDANGARILTDPTDGNAVVNVGELILSRNPAVGLPTLVSTNCGHASFAPTGFLRQVPALCFPQERAVLFCDDRGRRATAGSLSSARVVLVSRLGRAVALAETATVDAQITALGATCP